MVHRKLHEEASDSEFLDMVAGLNMAGLTATISSAENCK